MEILSDGMPDQLLVYPPIFVMVDVTRCSYGGPVNAGMPRLEIGRQSAGCFRDNLKRTHNGVVAAKSIPAVKLSTAAMLSTISAKRWAGLLEGIDGVAQEVIPETRL